MEGRIIQGFGSGTTTLHRGLTNDEMIEPTFNLRLIEAVKHSRCLFDSTDRQYRNTEYKNKVWNRLITVLNFDGDPRSLASRWKQLRDKYGKEKRKVKYGSDLGSTWQYYKHLQFLDPHMTDRADMSPSRKETQDVHMAVADPNFATRLIEAVKRQTCLFDIRDAKYRHAECRNQAWQMIIDELQFPGNVSSIYKQWKKNRDRYVREKRRIKSQLEIHIQEESSWELYNSMTWMDPYLDERAANVKRHHTNADDNLSDYGDMDDDPILGFLGGQRSGSGAGNGDVLLDGDSAFAASIVSDLRTLPEPTRAIARQQIEMLLETGKMPYLPRLL